MKNVYKEINQILGGLFVTELKEIGKEKELKGSVLVKFAGFYDEASAASMDDVPDAISMAQPSEPGLMPVDDKRIKAFVADEDVYRIGEKDENSPLSRAFKVLKTNIPDIKLFACGADMNSTPSISTGFLYAKPENAPFAIKLLKEAEGITVRAKSSGKEDLILSKAGSVLYAAIDLAKKEEFSGFNILVYLPDIFICR